MLKIFVAITLLIGVTCGEYTSPVFLWGVNSPALPSLQTVKQDHFANLLAPLLKTHSLVVFQEEHLSSRDFLCHKASGADSCYAQLQGFTPKTYYASVQNPSEAIRALTKSREYNIVDSTGNLQAPLQCETGKVTFVSFDDLAGDDQRAATLEAHDAAIATITRNLTSCKVAYLYMSTPTSAVIKTRSKRDTAATTGGELFREKNQFLIFFTSISYEDGISTGPPKPITITTMSVVNSTTNPASQFTVTLTATSGQTLTFVITHSNDGYYTLSKLNFAGQTFYTNLLMAPTTFSYSCGNLTLRTIPSQTEANPPPVARLRINSLQFQAPFNAKTPENFAFGDSWDCVPFFTPAILMGLVVVILLLTIAFVGMCWIMDINTMDRFDDPKGKTITINTAD